jgi:hypothetical protein
VSGGRGRQEVEAFDPPVPTYSYKGEQGERKRWWVLEGKREVIVYRREA